MSYFRLRGDGQPFMSNTNAKATMANFTTEERCARSSALSPPTTRRALQP